MKTNVKLLLILPLFSLCSCKNGKASSPAANNAPQDTIKAFTLPVIPPTLVTPEMRADYLIRNYWVNVNFADTNYVHHPELVEQAWVDYCDMLKHVPLETARNAMRQTIEKAGASKKVLTYIGNLAEKYLQDPNTPLRNTDTHIEEYNIAVLEGMIASPLLDDTEKIRPKALLDLANKNRLGTKATNFTYTLPSGAQGKLYNIQTKYTLLFINNPGCHACAEMTKQLQQAPTLNQLLDAKQLTLLALYPDEEIDLWKEHLKDFPTTWISAYDKLFTIRNKQLYDLKAIPTLHLLDKNKTVLLKDATAPAIEEYLKNHSTVSK